MKLTYVTLVIIIFLTSLVTYGFCHLFDGVKFPIISRSEYNQLNNHINGIDQYLTACIQQKVLPQVRK